MGLGLRIGLVLDGIATWDATVELDDAGSKRVLFVANAKDGIVVAQLDATVDDSDESTWPKEVAWDIEENVERSWGGAVGGRHLALDEKSVSISDTDVDQLEDHVRDTVVWLVD
tara:strand:- start:269 stop:610 length:342 start_codon:yes stop_codon:yes gene_type:complete